MSTPPQGTAGFTFVELLIVVLIVALLALLAVPSLDRAMQAWRSRGALEQLVEDVEVALVSGLVDHARLLEEVVGDAPADGIARHVELDLEILAEPGRVVVLHCLGVTERL